MDAFTDIISRIMHETGPQAFANAQKTFAMLSDLASGMKKERILARSFIEMNGLNTLRRAENPALAANVIIRGLVDDFSMRHSEAEWIVGCFASALGLDLPSAVQPAAAPTPLYHTRLPKVGIGRAHVAAVCHDGTTISGGLNSSFQCDTSGWQNVVSVSCGAAHTLGLDIDGKVLACGANTHSQCTCTGLTNVARVFAYDNTSICITKDGRALAFGKLQSDLSDFSEITDVAFYPNGLVGLRHDGSLVVYAPDAPHSELEWLCTQQNVARIVATYTSGIIALMRDGRLKKSDEPDTFFAQFQGITDIASLSDCFAALGEDGRVRIIGFERHSPKVYSDADGWDDIAAIYGGYRRLIGQQDTGKLLFTTTNVGWLYANPQMSLDFVSAWPPISGHSQGRMHILTPRGGRF